MHFVEFPQQSNAMLQVVRKPLRRVNRDDHDECEGDLSQQAGYVAIWTDVRRRHQFGRPMRNREQRDQDADECPEYEWREQQHVDEVDLVVGYSRWVQEHVAWSDKSPPGAQRRGIAAAAPEVQPSREQDRRNDEYGVAIVETEEWKCFPRQTVERAVKRSEHVLQQRYETFHRVL